MTQHPLSDEQSACVLAATSTSDNLLLTACAGGAKTTTMCAIARAFGPGRRIVALAFNGDAAKSLEAKMPYYVQSSTFHSFCYSTLGAFLGRKPKPDGNRTRWMLKELVPDWKMRREIEDSVLTLVSRFKSTTLDSDGDELQQVAEAFDIEADSSVIGFAKLILDKCLEPESYRKSIDFDDMLWLCLRLNVPFQPVAVVLLDEAQDTNGVQRALLRRMIGENPTEETMCNPPFNHVRAARLIAVGDPHQSIYGFRGADHNAMDLLRSDFAMVPLSLSISYRCSIAVCEEARKYL